MPEPSQRRIALAEPQHHVRAASLDLDVLAVAHDPKVALQVAERGQQGRGVEHHEGQQPSVSCFLCGAKPEAVADVAQRGGGAFDQTKYCSVRDAGVWMGNVGAPQADFLKEAVGIRTVLAKVVNDLSGYPSVYFVLLRHSAGSWNGF